MTLLFGLYDGTVSYGISYRELEEMLSERGVEVNPTTIYRWVQRYAPEIEARLKWY
jgi:IS6 family transposase